MLAQFFGLFERYAARHLRVRGRSLRLSKGRESLLGYVDGVNIIGTRVHVHGWAQTDQVIVHLGEAYAERKPSLLRVDVQEALGLPPNVGFELDLPLGEGGLMIELEKDGELYQFDAKLPSRFAIARARIRLWGRFLASLIRLSPKIIYGMRRQDPQVRALVRDGLELGPKVRWGTVQKNLFQESAPVDKAALDNPLKGLSIVLPVYNAFDLLEEVLDRVCRHTDLPWRLILIEDCSSDPRVRPWLRDWVEQARAETAADITVFENPENRGFIRSVNTGLEYAQKFEDPVVLLNSDAFVPAGWATRLLEPMQQDPDVATVTPMSNDAEIYSTPVICCQTHLSGGQGDAIDQVARRFSRELAYVSAPTGVGFCMALNMSFLRQVGLLDTAFGRGYGEEVDWCRRAAALGGKHVAQPRLFVEHRGGESFGSEEKLRLIRKNNVLIAQRYRDYDLSVQQFIHHDPLLSPRLVLALAWLDSQAGQPEVPVYIAHSMGGGADMYLERRIHQGQDNASAAVVLRLGGPMRCQLEVITPQGLVAANTDDLEYVATLIGLLRHRRIIYSCAVGDPDPVAIPDFIIQLANGSAIDILFHDFMPISPSYTLLGDDGRFCGAVIGRSEIASECGLNEDKAHEYRCRDGRRVSLQEWQTAWAQVLGLADRVVVFSQDSRRHVVASYPEVAQKIEVLPHHLLHDIPRLPPPTSAGCVLAVLGNTGFQKGAAVLEELSRLIEGNSSVQLVVIGKIDPAFKLGRHVRVHGNYAHADIPALAARYGISAWLIPSVWPETFSYTTFEALATGLPVLALDLGAQGDAVKAAPNGHIVALPRNGLMTSTSKDTAAAVLDVAKGLSE